MPRYKCSLCDIECDNLYDVHRHGLEVHKTRIEPVKRLTVDDTGASKRHMSGMICGRGPKDYRQRKYILYGNAKAKAGNV